MSSKNDITRRSFLSGVGLAVAAGMAAPKTHVFGETIRPIRKVKATFSDRGSRVAEAKKVRDVAARIALNYEVPIHQNNGEESDYPYIATYTKGMIHNDLGEVDLSCWNAFAKAIQSGRLSDFEKIPGNNRLLKDPLAGLCFELEGSDPTLFTMRPAPRIDSAENSAEMGELYWQALCRDINFTQYKNAEIINEAASDLSRFSQNNAPTLNGAITPATIFRGTNLGDLSGPYLSQFLVMEVPVSAPFSIGQHSVLTMSQSYQTVQANLDFVTDYDSWIQCNTGEMVQEAPKYQAERRYIRNGRDLANAVHIDLPWQFAINAAYILLNRKVSYDAGNPYKKSPKMEGFATFGFPHLMALIAEAGVRAARAVWFQKWWVHRRLRPETFGGRIHNHLRGATKYAMIDKEILNSSVLERILKANRNQPLGKQATYLLPQVYPEGCQLHPAYASGHAAMIGAAVTILKAWFDESAEMPQPVVPNDQGTELIPYRGPDIKSMSVGSELDKLASNISVGRMWAGIHWRSDATQGMELGEEVAIRLLREQSITYAEPASFTLTRFNGTTEVIDPSQYRSL